MPKVNLLININLSLQLNMRVHKIPSELEMTTTQLEIHLEKQSKLQQLRPTYTRISVLKQTEIPKLQ
jgi:hypothetical protein